MKLVVATAAQQQERDALTHAAWGSGLSVAQFQERERRLRAHPWAQRTMATWLWVDERGSVLSSCETFLDMARVGQRGGTAATIASVFTEPALRGRQHAEHMLRALVARLAQDPSCLAVTLFSEIGTVLYARLGFLPVPSFDAWYAPLDTAPANVTWEADALPSPSHPPGDAQTLRLLIEPDRLDWALERERIWQALLDKPALRAHGARAGHSSITWTAYWRANELHVLSLDVRSEADLEPLLQAARFAAYEVGLPTVRLWETRPLPGGRRAPRTDEIPMYCPLAPGVGAWTQVERALWA